MKTFLILLTFSTILSTFLLAQRNLTTDKKPILDRIDRVNDRNPVQNPIRNQEQIREPIQDPYREKINPIRPSTPYIPRITDPICNPHPPISFDELVPVSTILYPESDPKIDNTPVLEELPTWELFELGMMNLDNEIYNESIKCFNLLLKDDPLNYEYYCLRGRAYYGLELFDRAIMDFQRSVKLNKRYADGYYFLGLTEISLGNIDEAIVDFKLAADLGNQKAANIMKKYFK